MKRSVLCAAMAVAVLAAVVLAGCAGTGPANSSSSAMSSTGTASSSSTEATGAEDIIMIPLDYSAGTGFEWTCSADPEGIVTLVSQDTVDLAKDKGIAGGSLQEQFTIRAAKPGEVVLTFALARSWEGGDPAETQVYAFTVTDDLQMALNPYKSSFENEPEWGSNS